MSRHDVHGSHFAVTSPVDSSDVADRFVALDAKLQALWACYRPAGDDDAPEVAESRKELARLQADYTAVDRRRALVGDRALVALFGGTGSGKSALFNALIGQPARESGILRPTSTTYAAAHWADPPRSPALSNLGVSELLAANPETVALPAVLIDGPDTDSVRQEHWEMSDQLAKLADVLVVVLDPQKYADQRIHQNLLHRYRHLSSIMVVTLNKIDTIPPSQRDELMDDVQAKLRESGLGEVVILGTSAETGEGLETLRYRIDVAGRDALLEYTRSAAELHDLQRRLSNRFPSPPASWKPRLDRTDSDSFAQAAGAQEITAHHLQARRLDHRLRPRGLRPHATRELLLDRAHRTAAAIDRWKGRSLETQSNWWIPLVMEMIDSSALAHSVDRQLRHIPPPRPSTIVRALRVLRLMALTLAVLALVWLLLWRVGPVLQVRLFDPPTWTIESLGEFGYPVVGVMAGLSLYAVISGISRLLVWAQSRLTRGRISQQVARIVEASLDPQQNPDVMARITAIDHYRHLMSPGARPKH